MTGGGIQSLFAPAKINLTLQIKGKRPDGYHDLNSIAAFADIGDRITIEPADAFSFEITGPFAGALADENPEDNLVVRAVHLFAGVTGRDLDIKITLDKHLPVASGIGGGSADAASVLRGLAERWNVPVIPEEVWKPLGSDIAACLESRPVRMTGRGDVLEPVELPQDVPIVLVNPGVPCGTAEVYREFSAQNTMSSLRKQGSHIKKALPLQDPRFRGDDGFIFYLRDRANDLTLAACSVVPEIETVLSVLDLQDNCVLSRLSGSGATCFGLFSAVEDAARAAQTIQADYPGWWVKSGLLNPCSETPDKDPGSS